MSRIADAGRALSGIAGGSRTDIIALCRALLTGKGEATGIALAREVIDRYQSFDAAGKHAFFGKLAAGFGVDDEKLEGAIADYCRGDGGALRRLHLASEPSSLELLRRLNRAPGGTDALVAMRADLLDALATDKDLECLDKDFRHLFKSWFNRGFLDLRRIDWSTSAEVLDRIIAYEAVHEITSWEDLRGRVSAPDRRLYGFFHPSLANEPLIFVEVALTTDMPAAIDTILAEGREAIAPAKATTATFYSISNCQKGLRGISFGNFLIKQVVEELRRELPGLRTFVTLSPVPGLRRWAAGAVEQADPLLSETQRDGLERLADGAGPAEPDTGKLLRDVAARYLVLARSPKGGAVDPVARFHLGNGARLERINCAADHSARGLRDSWGVMVNYRYALDDIERNHESYVSGGDVACSSAVRRLL